MTALLFRAAFLANCACGRLIEPGHWVAYQADNTLVHAEHHDDIMVRSMVEQPQAKTKPDKPR